MDKLKVLDLFSGIGGFSLGLERTGGFETVAFCEIEEFPQKVLKKHWPDVPIYNDVRRITDELKGSVDVITGGYPCQPFSVAGKRQGKGDDRHLWPAMFACIKEYRPRWVIGENVAGHINMGIDDVLSDLESEGYTARAFVIPAVSVGAIHRRDRVWVISNSGDDRLQECTKEQIFGFRHIQGKLVRSGEAVGIVPNKGEPVVSGVTNGIPDRAHRIKALGNAVVPQIPEIIGNAILEIENYKEGEL